MNNELIERPSWWKRNWKWALPTGGCLTLIIAVIAVISFGIFQVVDAVKENTNYEDVLTKVQSDSRVIEALGEPIESNGIGSYNISISNGERSANAIVPIKGPQGKGEIYITTSGDKENPVYEKLEVYIEDTDSIINLMQDGLDEESSEDF